MMPFMLSCPRRCAESIRPFRCFCQYFEPHPGAWLMRIDFAVQGNSFFAAQIAAGAGHHEHRSQEQQLSQRLDPAWLQRPQAAEDGTTAGLRQGQGHLHLRRERQGLYRVRLLLLLRVSRLQRGAPGGRRLPADEDAADVFLGNPPHGASRHGIDGASGCPVAGQESAHLLLDHGLRGQRPPDEVHVVRQRLCWRAAAPQDDFAQGELPRVDHCHCGAGWIAGPA